MPQYELNLRDYWQIIQKRRFILTVIFTAVFVSTVIYSNLQTPVYQATASVQWAERKTIGGMLTDLVTVNTSDPMATQSRIIMSMTVLEEVVKELGLAGEHSSPQEIAEQAGAMQEGLSTEVVTGTNIIRVTVTHNDPGMASSIADKIAEVYVAESLKEKTKETRGVREFIEKQLEEVGVKLSKSEDALARFKEVEVPSGIALPLQNRLSELETARQEFLKTYTLKHPDVKRIDEQISALKDQLRVLPQKELEYSRLMRDVEININIFRQLKEKLEAARISEAEKSGDASIVDRAVLPQSPVSPNKPLNYMLGAVIGLLLGLAATFVVEQLDTSMGTIEDVENYLKLPTLGIIPYLKTKDEKERNLIQRLIPSKEARGQEKFLRLRKQLLIHYSSSSPVFESYRILRTNIQTEVFKEKMKNKILLLSSSGPEEGKSITVSNLAIVMAQANMRTLLIDADMRRSTIHRIFGFKDREPGLCNVLRGTIKIEQAMRTFTDILTGEFGFDEALKVPGLDGLNILTSGAIPNIPAELLGSPEMTALLERLKDRFDVILIDTPPVMAVADAMILAPKADGVILVYRVGKTARSILARAKTQLVESGAQVKGVILNNISPEIEMRYNYYYNYKYYGKYYGEKKEEA